MFHSYVMRGHTGDAATFAAKLGISRASLYNLINELRSYGIEIEYCREQQTYRYLYPDMVEVKITVRQIETE